MNIILAGVNIYANNAGIKIKDNATFNVNIMIADGSENILVSRSSEDAGLQKDGSGNDVGTLTIGVPPNSKGTGKLMVTGGVNSSAIGGGGSTGSTRNIKITGGTVTANGGWGGPGIGGWIWRKWK